MPRPKRNSGIEPKLMEAAVQGDTRSQCKIGWIYFEGWVVPKDLVAAEAWWRKAADAGNASAQYLLGFNKPNSMSVDEALS
jgi:TPR repeat protein